MTTLSQKQAAVQGNVNETTLLKRIIPKRWGVHLFLIVTCAIVGFPLFYAALVSTQDNTDVYSYRFTPGTAFARNWDTTINKRNLPNYMFNTVVVAVVVTVAKT